MVNVTGASKEIMQKSVNSRLGIPSLGGAKSRSVGGAGRLQKGQFTEGRGFGPDARALFSRRRWRKRIAFHTHADPADEDHFSRELRRVQPPTDRTTHRLLLLLFTFPLGARALTFSAPCRDLQSLLTATTFG